MWAVIRGFLMVSLIEKVANWQQDAGEEKTNYFFKKPEFDKLLTGDRLLVLGRKGSGKTALHKFVMGHCIGKSILHRPYEADSVDYSKLNSFGGNITQITAFWKELILGSALELVSSKYSNEQDESPWMRATQGLSNWVNYLLESEFDIEVSGVSLKKSANMDWQKRADDTRDAIAEKSKEIGASEDVFIIFDRLDQGFRNRSDAEADSTYLNSILGLIRAALEIRREATSHYGSINIRPIILLRTDIYDLLKDPDKNRWTDRSVSLRWGPSDIKRLLGHRIAIDVGSGGPGFSKNWGKITSGNEIDDRYDGYRSKDLFDFISLRTCWRPRDYIYYVRECARYAHENGANRISISRVKNTEFNYSNWLRNEFLDEAEMQVPNLTDILASIAHMVVANRKTRNFTKDQFSEALGRRNNQLEETLRSLYSFGILGNSTGGGAAGYKFLYTTDFPAEFNIKGNIIIHPGLYRSMI